MPRTVLDRDAIVVAAFAVLDRGGLAGVTARAVAAELGVHAGAIYYHLPDMATLYDEMATALERRMAGAVATPEAWDELLHAFGGTLRGVLLGVRDGGRLFAGRRLRDPALLPAMEQPLEILCAAGLDVGAAAAVLETVRDLTVGFVIEEQHRASAESGEYTPAARAALVGPAAPLTVAASAPMLAAPDGRYASALDLLIEGVRARIRSATP